MKRIIRALGILLMFAVSTGLATAAERRVVKDNPLAGYPYNTWSNAAASIQEAIDAADPGDTILVTNGVYDTGGRAATGASLTNRVTIDKAVTVIALSTNPADTVITGQWEDNGYTGYPGTPPNGPGAIRCVYMVEGAALAGFTLTNGATRVSTANDGRAGGVFCTGLGASVSNCVIVNASGNRDAACAYYGTYYDCRFLRSHGGQGRRHVSQATLYRCNIIGKYPDDYYDGGVLSSTLYRCLVTRCYQKNGGGVTSSTLYDSIVTGNRGGTTEGGVSGSTLYNCIIASNTTARTGAGINNCTAVNCRIFDNVGGWYAAAADISTLYTCLIVSNQVTVNTSAKGGAVADGSRLFNCTVVDNATAVTGHGAVSNCVVQNTILWNNTAKGVVVNYADVNNVFSNSCTTPVPAGGWAPGNMTEPPSFKNAATGDYHLGAGSPCTDKGMNFAWMRDPEDARSRDLDGNPRILPRSGTVDMGAFERKSSPGSILTIR